MEILNLTAAPSDPIERIIWLDGIKEAVTSELDSAYETCYFEARTRGLFEAAVQAGRTSRKRALAYTRHVNERLGRTIRWGDGIDPSSTNYEG